MLKVGLISLGCSRNLVDSEVILGSLKKDGFKIADVGDGVDIFIINTCSFVESARAESIDTILEAAEMKRSGNIKYLVVSGCLGQLYREKLLKEIPEIDLLLGTSDFSKITSLLKVITKGRKAASISKRPAYLYDEHSPRLILTERHFAYVKVSEGCSNACSYCIISRLRGRFRSRTIGSVIEEVKKLSLGGALKEIELVGQDTTLFGMDSYGAYKLADLLKKICALKNSVEWVRILYTHPAHYTDNFIKTVRDEGRIAKYLDLPIQHISDHILKAMGRRCDKAGITGLIERLRKDIPGIFLRTSIIVGFPQETDRDFKELLGFIRDTKFERLGAFIYSRESGTRAARLKGQVPEKVKNARFDEVMKLQQKVAQEVNRKFLGRRLKVLVDEKIEGEKDKFLARTEGDAPEVDGSVYVTGKGIKPGEFYNVKITDTLEYDLVGEKI